MLKTSFRPLMPSSRVTPIVHPAENITPVFSELRMPLNLWNSRVARLHICARFVWRHTKMGSGSVPRVFAAVNRHYSNGVRFALVLFFMLPGDGMYSQVL